MLKRGVWRQILAVAILALTAFAFVKYFGDHPEVRRQLGETSPLVLLAVFGLYFVFVVSLALINTATLKLCDAKISHRESLLLTMYSSIINFFGPLQSGPAFRALYVKQKHGISLRDYTIASFVYYFFYAVFSGLLLLAVWLKAWFIPLLILLLALMWVARHSPLIKLPKIRDIAFEYWYYMAFAALLQVLLLVAIYFTELRSIDPSITIYQAATYAGAANFALFVSLTPGAIGFRESFLLFTQNLHHIDSSTIVAASLIDRSVYIILLLLLSGVILLTHARSRLLRLDTK